MAAVEQSRSDRTIVVAAVVGGLLLWFAYVAVQPHDLFGPHAGTPASLRTFFGWAAPSYPLQRDPNLIINPPDRSWIVLAGWPVLALALGWLVPRRPWLVGGAVVAPTAVVYLWTAPLDIDGLGRGGIIFLPFVAACCWRRSPTWLIGLPRWGPASGWFSDRRRRVLKCRSTMVRPAGAVVPLCECARWPSQSV